MYVVPRCPALLGWSALAESELEDVHLCKPQKVSDQHVHINSNVLEESNMIHPLDIRLVSLIRVLANVSIYRKMNSLKFLIWLSSIRRA